MKFLIILIVFNLSQAFASRIRCSIESIPRTINDPYDNASIFDVSVHCKDRNYFKIGRAGNYLLDKIVKTVEDLHYRNRVRFSKYNCSLVDRYIHTSYGKPYYQTSVFFDSKKIAFVVDSSTHYTKISKSIQNATQQIEKLRQLGVCK